MLAEQVAEDGILSIFDEDYEVAADHGLRGKALSLSQEDDWHIGVGTGTMPLIVQAQTYEAIETSDR